ncbi:MAG: tRNA epoxyqueuosine(34) reductase QueG [Planctomycetota bacterium]|jgi:epoxyqueuosine reductase
MALEADIKQKALALGFDAVGITTAAAVDAAQVAYFQRWLEDGCAGDMGYMGRNVEKRFDPAKLLTGAQSVICVMLNYRPQCGRSVSLRENISQTTKSKQDACSPLQIANFALYEDYHPFMKERLFELAEFIKTTCGRDVRAPKFKACVDSAPLAERALAQRAGLGFFGRNHMLIHPELGCQTLLGELITTVELEPDEAAESQSCGDCGKCIRACPTGALDFDGGFDARKCISYLTIESQNDIPSEHTGKLGNRIFGCDACIAACPHEMNKLSRVNSDFQFHSEWTELTTSQILDMTESEFQSFFAGSGMIRTGLEKIKQTIKGVISLCE